LKIGREKSARRSWPIGPIAGEGRSGTSTSSIVWTRKVALARISTSISRDADWSGMAWSFSRRCIRKGEKASATGTANSQR
jgi:hypothetical protein